MKYLERRFSVPAAGPSVTQEEWDRIFGEDSTPENPGGSSEKSDLTGPGSRGSIKTEEDTP